MARFRTAGAAAIFLFGSTFLWVMSSLPGTRDHCAWRQLVGHPGTGPRHCGGVRWGRLGLGKASEWWKPLAIVGLVLGMVVLLIWWSAVSSISGVTNLVANLALHAAGIAVLLVLLIASLARRLDRLLAAYPAGPA
jgi:hypothetical protein